MTRYLDALPFALPALAAGLVFAVWVSRPVARWSGERRAPTLCWLAGLALVLAATVTPSSSVMAVDPEVVQTRVWIWGLPDAGAFFSINWQSMNLLLFLPIGIACGLFGRRRTTAVFTGAALGASVLVEVIQYAVPALGRPQFNSATVIIGWVGIGLGLVVCLLVGTLRRHSVRKRRGRALSR